LIKKHAIHHFHCKDVLRFLGRRITGLFNGEVRSHMGNRVEGVRMKLTPRFGGAITRLALLFVFAVLTASME
jgi:hypothetical protein